MGGCRGHRTGLGRACPDSGRFPRARPGPLSLPEVVFCSGPGAPRWTCSPGKEAALTLVSFQVTKWKNIIQVDVDTDGSYTVGPSQPPAPSARATFYVGGLPGEGNAPKPGEILPRCTLGAPTALLLARLTLAFACPLCRDSQGQRRVPAASPPSLRGLHEEPGD